jgi:hypothetical protein
MTVDMGVSILARIPKDHARRSIGFRKHDFQFRPDSLERHLLCQREIQVLGEAILRKVALFEGRPTLE